MNPGGIYIALGVLVSEPLLIISKESLTWVNLFSAYFHVIFLLKIDEFLSWRVSLGVVENPRVVENGLVLVFHPLLDAGV